MLFLLGLMTGVVLGAGVAVFACNGGATAEEMDECFRDGFEDGLEQGREENEIERYCDGYDEGFEAGMDQVAVDVEIVADEQEAA